MPSYPVPLLGSLIVTVDPGSVPVFAVQVSQEVKTRIAVIDSHHTGYTSGPETQPGAFYHVGLIGIYYGHSLTILQYIYNTWYTISL